MFMAGINKIAIIFALILLIISPGCVNEDRQKQEEYEKCTSVCASVLSDDFVTLELCREECREEFLEEN
jgi:hypothetical protein